MAKNKYFNKSINPKRKLLEIKTMYANKYYNYFMNLFSINGLEEDLFSAREQNDFIFREFWSVGTCACLQIKPTENLAFCPYAPISYNLYNKPVEAEPIRLHNAQFIPNKILKVNEDIVLGWISKTEKPVRAIVDYYIDRISQVEMIINTNLELHKMPFLISCDASDKDNLQDIVDRILNNEVVVFTELEQVSLIKAIESATPYIVDKLHAYRVQLENELLSYLGIDNGGNVEKATTMLLDEVNSNNEIINFGQYQFKTNIEEWLKLINKTFNKNLTLKINVKPAQESFESRNRSDGEKDSNFSRQNERGGEE